MSKGRSRRRKAQPRVVTRIGGPSQMFSDDVITDLSARSGLNREQVMASAVELIRCGWVRPIEGGTDWQLCFPDGRVIHD